MNQLPSSQFTAGESPAGGSPKGAWGAAVAFGYLSLVGGILLLVANVLLRYFAGGPLGLIILAVIVGGGVGAIVAARSGHVIAYAALQMTGVALYFALSFWLYSASLLRMLVPLVIVAGAVGVIVTSTKAKAALRQTVSSTTAVPLGYTTDGAPFYPVVGYRTDGTPVTADQAPGFSRPRNSTTNATAIVALVLALVFTPAGIVCGHVARSQIRRTGEQGAGIALAALVIGYAWLGFVLVAIAAVALGAMRF
jgi:hypothetical protein